MNKRFAGIVLIAALVVGPADAGEPVALTHSDTPPPTPAAPTLSADPIVLGSLPKARLTNVRNVVVACADAFRASKLSQPRGAEQVVVHLALYVGRDHRVSAVAVTESSGISALDVIAERCIANAARIDPTGVVDDEPGSWQQMKWTWRWAP